MKPGRELDALVAEKVMGLPVVDGKIRREAPAGTEPEYLSAGIVVTARWWETEIPPYSTDIAQAWQVVEKLSNDSRPGMHYSETDGFHFNLEHFRDKYNWFWQARFGSCEAGDADTAPHAICLAALRAVGVS